MSAVRLSAREARAALDLLAGAGDDPDVERLYCHLRGARVPVLSGEDAGLLLSVVIGSDFPWSPPVLSLVRKLDRSI